MEPLEHVSNGAFCSPTGDILVAFIVGRVVHLAVILSSIIIFCTIRSVLVDRATPFGAVVGWRSVVVVIISVN